MKKMMTLAACALVTSAAFANEQQKDNVKENASKQAVEEVLAQPDGVSLVRNEKDGSLQIFALGTASYDFGDARDIRNKTKAAELRERPRFPSSSTRSFLSRKPQQVEKAGCQRPF